MKATVDSTGGATAESRLFWQALGVFLFCVVMSWTVGAWLQRLHFAVGMAMTELCFFVLPAVLFLHRHRALLDSGPFDRPAFSDVVRAGCLGALIIAVAVAVGISVRRFLGIQGSSQDLPAAVLAVIWLLVPLGEELLFRPVLQRVFSSYGTPGGAVLATALLFGLLHSSWLRFGETFILGFLGGVVFLKTGNWWACVVFHGVANVAGPFLFKHADDLAWLFHPVTSGLLLVAALGIVYRLGPHFAGPFPGIIPRLQWLLFSGRLAAGRRLPDRAMVIAYGALVIALAATLSALLPPELAFHQRGALLSAATQTEHWTIQDGGMVRAHSRVDFKVWPNQQPLLVELPYPEARPLVIHLSGVAAGWQPTAPGHLEVLATGSRPEAGEKSLDVIWEIPVSSLASGAAYRAQLWPLFALSRFSLTLALEPDCGFVFIRHPAAREALLVRLNFKDRPRDTGLGYCELGVQRTSALHNNGRFNK